MTVTSQIRLDLVEVNVSDWDASVDWYRRAFNLDVSYEDREHRWCELAFPGSGPRFALRGLDGVDHRSPAAIVITLEVGNVEAAVEELRGRGVDIAERIKEATRPDGTRYRWANLADPDGNQLRVFEWAGKG